MSTDREVTRIVRSWLEEGATALPDRVLDAVLDQVPATRQRRPWWPARRLPHMNTSFRIAAALVAVVVLAFVVVNLMPRPAVVGGPPSTPTATPAPTPSPMPASTLPPGGSIFAPGTYQSDFVTFTVPAGWYYGVTVVKPDAGPPNGMALDWERGISTVYNDPCRSQTTAVSVGPTVDNLVAAFVAQKRGSIATPTNVMIDGFNGKQIDLVVPPTVNIATCDGGQYASWGQGSGPTRVNQAAGQHDLLDILDVNGKTTVIRRSYYAANTAADLAELQAIFDSIKIAP